MRFGPIALILIGMMVASAAEAAPPITPRPLKQESYGESITGVALLENNTYLLVQVLLTNAGFGSEKPVCRGLIVPPSGKTWNKASRGDDDDWSVNKGKNQLKALDCLIRGGGADTEYKVTVEGVTLHLRSPEALSARKTPGNRIKTADGIFEYDLWMRWSPVKVTLRGQGLQKWDNPGNMYVDHTRSNLAMKDVADSWLRFRGFRGENRVVFQARKLKNRAFTGWYWPENKGSAIGIKGKAIQRKVSRGKEEVTLTLSAGDSRVSTQQLLFSYKPVDEFGVLGKMAKPFIGDPIVRTYLATWTWPDGTTVTGILETTDMD